MFPFRRKRPQRSRSSNRSVKTPRKNFAAVEIRPAEDACKAVGALAGIRFLSAAAPLLPVAECDRPNGCRCRYEHFSDRRFGPRRRADGALPSHSHSFSVERRTAADRRKEWHED